MQKKIIENNLENNLVSKYICFICILDNEIKLWKQVFD